MGLRPAGTVCQCAELSSSLQQSSSRGICAIVSASLGLGPLSESGVNHSKLCVLIGPHALF